VAGANGAKFLGCGDSAKSRVERPAGIACSDHLAGINIKEGGLPGLTRRHVTHLARETEFEFFLNCKVPRLNVTAIKLFWPSNEADVAWDVNNAIPHTNLGYRRNPCRQGPLWKEITLDIRLIESAQDGVIREQRLQTLVGIVGDPVACTDYKAVCRPIGDSQAGAKRFLLTSIPLALGTDPIPQTNTFASVRVVTFDTSVGPSRNWQIFPADAQVDRYLGGNIPPIPGIEAVKPSPNVSPLVGLKRPTCPIRQIH
jgi:hypothetical protein